MALYFASKQKNESLPDIFKNKGFRSYASMADFADSNELPEGEYWIRNDKGTNLLTSMRELKYDGSRFWVEGKGYI